MAEIYLECNNCGNEIKMDRAIIQNNMLDIIYYVDPCPKCMRERGLEDAKKKTGENQYTSKNIPEAPVP